MWAITLGVVGSLPLIYILSRGHERPGGWVAAFWCVAVATFLLLSHVKGWLSRQTPLGIWVNDRNLASMSKAQFWTWLCLLMATTLTAVVFQIYEAEDLEVVSDPKILGLLGLATGGLAGASAIASGKAGKTPNKKQVVRQSRRFAESFGAEYFQEMLGTSPDETEATLGIPSRHEPRLAAGTNYVESTKARGAPKTEVASATLQTALRLTKNLDATQRRQLVGGLVHMSQGSTAEEAGALSGFSALEKSSLKHADVRTLLEQWAVIDVAESNSGLLYANRNPWDARLSDLFEGDEIAGAAEGDLGKIQLALFTLMAMGAYAYAIFRAFSGQSAPDEVVPGELLTALLGSQGAYVASKLPNRSTKA